MFRSGWYMASTASVPEIFDETMGVIQTARQSPYKTRLSRGVPWCLDNGVFTGKFEEKKWLKQIDSFREYKDTLIFITIPDVVGDCLATLKRFSYYRRKVKNYPVALVSQDGIKQHASKIPWDEFDCIFVGGTDTHKLGIEGRWIIEQAKNRGKWVHVGRVNSVSRMLSFWEADSYDGTHLSFFPSDVSKFHSTILQIRNIKKMGGLFQ